MSSVEQRDPAEGAVGGDAGGGRDGIFRRLYDGTTSFRFIPHRRRWFLLSGLVIAVGLLTLLGRGLNLGIDFEGGTAWELPVQREVSVDEARDAVAEVGLEEATVQTLTGNGQTRLRVEAEPSDEVDQGEVSDVLAALAGAEAGEVSVTEVGPSWGDEITDKAIRALLVFLAIIVVYISVRFEWKMAVATLVALLHDILVTVGVYAITGLEVTPATVVAFLTILGYSIYDGIVVFDKVDENARALSTTGRGATYSDMVDSSLNQVLMRTLNTSITALLPILSLLVIGSFALGASTLREFALALLIGLASGAYSSIFIASPVLAMLKEREPRFAQLRARSADQDRRGSGAPGTPTAGRRLRSARAERAEDDASVPEGDEVVADREPAGVGADRPRPAPASRQLRPAPIGAGGITPRPRKKGKKR